MSATKLMADLTRRGIRLRRQGDQLMYSPQSAVTSGLAGRMKQQKNELLAMISAEPVTRDDRRQAYESLIERVNAGYAGGPIDWSRLDAIEQRIWTAATTADLTRAVAEYENVVFWKMILDQ